jgi:hypothetical protein
VAGLWTAWLAVKGADDVVGDGSRREGAVVIKGMIIKPDKPTAPATKP